VGGYSAAGGVFTISRSGTTVRLVSELRIEDLKRALVVPSGPYYAALDVVSSTGSTNADLVAAAASGAEDRTVLIAERQTAGRGRRSRDWISPPESGLYLSVLLRPGDVPAARLGGLAVVAGLALQGTAVEFAGVDAMLKWPNDLLTGPALGKCAGVLSEAAAGGAAVVVGIGLNVTSVPGEVPAGPGGLIATSLAEAGARVTDRTEIAIDLLTRFASLESSWRSAGGDLGSSGLLTDYRAGCATLGQRVRVELPSGDDLTGLAADLTPAGELVIKSDDGGEVTVSAGDVVHLRQEP
jgi:BirA family transcriptional regulator, biotin operon repressor / biotin---[acetyl-CoA-carboxylase] ligase